MTQILGSLIQEINLLSGASLVEGQQGEEGPREYDCKDRLREQSFFDLKKRRLSGIFVYSSLMGKYGEDGAILLSEVHSGRRRRSGKWEIPTECGGKNIVYHGNGKKLE